MKLFEALLIDEEGHIDFLETQLDLLGKIGVENMVSSTPIPPTKRNKLSKLDKEKAANGRLFIYLPERCRNSATTCS